MSESMTKEEFEARDAAFQLRLKRLGMPAPKPQVSVSGARVSEKLAEAAKANPESVRVRVSARGADGVVVVDPPRRAEQLKVVEVENGKPVLARCLDLETGQWGNVHFVEGYRKPSGAESNYNPIDRLRGGDE